MINQPRDAAPPDVGVLLDALRTDVRARRLAQPSAAIDPLTRDLQRALDDIELSRVVSAHWPLIGHTLPTRAVALVNKLVRRYLRWYINPIVEQQNAYNDAVARTLRLLAEAYGDLTGQNQRSQEPEARSQKPGARSEEPQPAARSPQHAAHSTATLQALVRVYAAAEPPAAFPDLDLRAQELQLGLRQNVSAHWSLDGRTLPQRGVATLNKLVRRYLRWYINPIVEQQNAANAAITVALLAFVRLDAERRAVAAARRAVDKTRRQEDKKIKKTR